MINFKSKPLRWVSAHREIKYVFDYETLDIAGCFENSDGKMGVLPAANFVDAIEVGQYVFIDSGLYAGYHVITYIDSYVINTNTDFTEEQFTGKVKYVTPYIFRLYSGWSYPQVLADLVPFEIRAEFSPEPNLNGLLEFNISGYVNKIFDVINSNDAVDYNNNTIYYNLFAPVLLLKQRPDGNFSALDTINVLNSAISMLELNRDYVQTQRNLNDGNLGPHYIECINSNDYTIKGNYVVKNNYREATTGNVTPPTGFNQTDFSNQFAPPTAGHG